MSLKYFIFYFFVITQTQKAVGAPEYLGILIHFSIAVLQFIPVLALVAKTLLPTLNKPPNPAQPHQKE